jgi:tetrahydromethanopterin S-methyltransferase subunit F
MNTPLPDEWSDLARMWQADAASISLQEVDRHLEREKRQMAGVHAAECAGLGAGIIAAICVVALTHFWMGVVIVLFGGTSAWLTLRMRRTGPVPGSRDLLQSLKDSIEREDWIAEQLRFGRVLSFVALFAIVQATSVQLFRLKAFSTAALLAAGIGSAVVLGTLAWNLWLTARSRRRRTRLQYLDERLKA